MWMKCVQKHFTDRRWHKYYNEIVFSVLSVDQDLKPAFLWDIGPGISPRELSAFIHDLQALSLISNDIIVVTVHNDIFISKTSSLLHSLNGGNMIMDITESEVRWRLFESNDTINKICDCIRENVQDEDAFDNGIINFNFDEDLCVPSIFGLLLGYPLVYYFELDYPKTPVTLILYKVSCRFGFCGTSKRYVIYSFSVPEVIWDSHVDGFVHEWFHCVSERGDKNIFCDVDIVSSKADVISLNL